MKKAFLILSVLYLTGCFSKEPEKTGREGQIVPNFKILLVDSSTYLETASIPTGKPFVLFLFGPHCPYSKAQMENIIEDIDKLKGIRLILLTRWPFKDMKDFYNHYKLSNYPNIIMGLDFTNYFLDYFKAPGVPYLAIYGKDKKLKKVFIGNTDVKQIKQVAEE